MKQVDHHAKMEAQDPHFPDYDERGWPAPIVGAVLNVGEDVVRLRQVGAALRSTNALRGEEVLRIAESLENGAAPAARYMAEIAGPGLPTVYWQREEAAAPAIAGMDFVKWQYRYKPPHDLDHVWCELHPLGQPVKWFRADGRFEVRALYTPAAASVQRGPGQPQCNGCPGLDSVPSWRNLWKPRGGNVNPPPDYPRPPAPPNPPPVYVPVFASGDDAIELARQEFVRSRWPDVAPNRPTWRDFNAAFQAGHAAAGAASAPAARVAPRDRLPR